MTHTVYCKKLKKEAEGLLQPPYPGEIGQKLFENISKQAWEMWLQRQTMFINEYRLNLADSKSREMLKKEMENFLFGESDKLPEGYVPPEK